MLTERIVATRARGTVVLMRLAVGGVFLSEGVQKFLFPGEVGAGRFAKIGLPSPEFLGPFVGAFEIACGAAIQADKVKLALELALERRPKGGASAQPFLTEDLPAVVAAIDAKDAARYQAALERLRRHAHGATWRSPCPSSPPSSRSAASP